MKRLSMVLALGLVSLVVAAALAEFAYRWLLAPAPARTFYEDADRNSVDPSNVSFVEANPDVPEGRIRSRWKAGTRFYICYDPPTGRDLDARGCVLNEINRCQIRDREAACDPKPAGERRVVCLGDSFTFGWGVPIEKTWVRRVERELRTRDDRVRTINCGASGTLFVDEHWHSLRARFHAFDPDVVVVTLCLNDLIPSTHQLSHRHSPPSWIGYSRLIHDLVSSYVLSSTLEWGPETDPVADILSWPAEVYGVIPWLAGTGVGRAQMWAGGGPQRALTAMRDWCEQREVEFGVVIWPYFQGLGPGAHYPFASLHHAVGQFCAAERIPFLDVLPALENQPASSLWVHASDLHGNSLAHQLASPSIAAFCARLLGD